MKQILIGVAYLAAVLFLAGIVLGGFYLRSLQRPAVVGQADARPSPSAMSMDSPTPSDLASPSPTDAASPITPSPSAKPAIPANPPTHPAPACPPEVITSFTAKAAPRSVILSWTVSGGCGNESGFIQGSFGTQSTGTTMYPGLWVVNIQRAWGTYTDHPQKPANAGQVCLFSLTYFMALNGVAPDGRAPTPATTEVVDVNLC